VVRIVLGIVTIAALASVARARADDAPCERARRALKHQDLVRASIAAADCRDAAVRASIDGAAGAAGWSPVEIETVPAGATVTVEPALDTPFTAPRTVWLPPGRHEVRGLVDGQPVVSALAIARGGKRTLVHLDVRVETVTPRNGSVDFEEQGGGEVASGPPPKVELPSLLPERYRRGVDAEVTWTDEPAARRPGPWRLALGPTLLAADGDRGWGATVELAYRVRRALRDEHIDVTPALAATVVSSPDAMGSAAQVRGTILVEAEAPLPRRTNGFLGLGPEVVTAVGDAPFDGTTLALAAGAELAGRPSGWSFGVRGDLPLVSTAQRTAVTLAVLFGRRW